MIITICGSIKFLDEMHKAKKALETLGHEVLTPDKKEGNSLIGAELKFRHMDKINKSDAILVMNITSEEIEDRIGGSTFLEIGFAHYKKKKIFLLNPIPNQSYIIDEIETVNPQIINGDYSKII